MNMKGKSTFLFPQQTVKELLLIPRDTHTGGYGTIFSCGVEIPQNSQQQRRGGLSCHVFTSPIKVSAVQLRPVNIVS